MEGAKTIGILGGMGPLATVEFFRRLVAATPAGIDQDHLHIVIDNDPSVPNRTDAILRGGPSPVPILQAMARRLEAAGAQLLAMPCNTGHVYIEEIRQVVAIPAVDMIAETATAVPGTSIGLLATDGTIGTRIYHDVFEARGIAVIAPDRGDQEAVMAAIERIKAGEPIGPLRERLSGIVGSLAEAGAEAVVAGCTEISLVPGDGMPIPWIDALDCLVEATLDCAGANDRVRERKEAE